MSPHSGKGRFNSKRPRGFGMPPRPRFPHNSRRSAPPYRNPHIGNWGNPHRRWPHPYPPRRPANAIRREGMDCTFCMCFVVFLMLFTTPLIFAMIDYFDTPYNESNYVRSIDELEYEVIELSSDAEKIDITVEGGAASVAFFSSDPVTSKTFSSSSPISEIIDSQDFEEYYHGYFYSNDTFSFSFSAEQMVIFYIMLEYQYKNFLDHGYFEYEKAYLGKNGSDTYNISFDGHYHFIISNEMYESPILVNFSYIAHTNKYIDIESAEELYHFWGGDSFSFSISDSDFKYLVFYGEGEGEDSQISYTIYYKKADVENPDRALEIIMISMSLLIGLLFTVFFFKKAKTRRSSVSYKSYKRDLKGIDSSGPAAVDVSHVSSGIRIQNSPESSTIRPYSGNYDASTTIRNEENTYIGFSGVNQTIKPHLGDGEISERNGSQTFRSRSTGLQFCPYCGSQLDDVGLMHLNERGFVFCPGCGMRINIEEL